MAYGVLTPAHASSTVFGTTPAQIHEQFGAAVRDHLTSLKRERGVNAVYHALWGLSSFQYYEMCQLYAASPTGGSCALLFDQVLNLSSGAAKGRLEVVNLQFNQSIYKTSVPGGQRRVQKITPPTIAGYPPNTVVSEVTDECILATGDGGQGLALAVRTLAPEVTLWFGGSYAFGTGISWLIQTYDPELQRAIGDDIGAIIDEVSTDINLEVSLLDSMITVIDVLGSPGLSDVDFDGYQLEEYP